VNAQPGNLARVLGYEALVTAVPLPYRISMVLELSDLDVIEESALRRFDERVAKADPANREGIEREAARLESQLEQLYSLTALMARREPDMAGTAELWGRLVKICDVFAGRVFQFSQQHALSTSAYDNILDIRSAAEELRALHCP
jgi:hypothetical protein